MEYDDILSAALTVFSNTTVVAIMGAGGVAMVAGGLLRAFKRFVR